MSSSYPLFSGDSTAPFMEEMLSALAGRGHSVSVLVPRVAGLVEGSRSSVNVVGAGYAPKGLQAWGHGRSLDPNGRLRRMAIVNTPFAIASLARAMRAVLREERPDLVHLHWLLPQGVLAEVVPKTTPLVVSIHGADARFANGVLRPLAERVLDRADAIVAASRSILEPIIGDRTDLEAKCRVVPHGANADLFADRDRRQARVTLGLPPDSPIILGLGRLVSKKGFDALAGSLSHLRSTNAHIYLVGEGPDRARLESTIPTTMRHRIHLVGARDRHEVADWYAASDVVVIPSQPVDGDVDSGPVVLMEALAAGRPVIATRVGMAPNIIATGVNGWLLDSNSPEHLAEAIDAVLAESEALGVRARQSFDEVGDWSRVAAQLEDVYRNLLQVGGSVDG